LTLFFFFFLFLEGKEGCAARFFLFSWKPYMWWIFIIWAIGYVDCFLAISLFLSFTRFFGFSLVVFCQVIISSFACLENWGKVSKERI
jgi:hypothetical protein